uniref:E3 ubiquitin-protein ligase n=1 Tax=Anopheles albimanus TaxID=7167 RepID=A0A182FBD7_ANOAL
MQCGAKLSEKRQRNPIEQLLQHAKTSCRYEENGCTWQFSATEMDSHVQECKFRPYRCITSTLNVLKCDWIGLQHEIEKHLLEEHKELGPVFRFRESSSLVFCDKISIGGLKLVDAFSKHFLFYFFSDVDRGTISFLMIYFGRHEESDQYCYELEIRSLPMAPPVEQSATATKDAPSAVPAAEERPAMTRSVKFVERCYSDSDNLAEVIEDERCIALSHQQVRNYLHKGKLYFTFKVRKVSEPGRERKSSESGAIPADIPGATPAPAAATAAKPKPKPPPFVFANKGKVAANTKRSGGSAVASGAASSSSSSSSSKGGSGGSRPNSGSPNGTVLPSPSPSISRPPSYASTVNVGSQGQELTTTGNPTPSSSRYSGSSSYSSINKVVVVGLHSPFEKPENCPLMTPSINKQDVVSGHTFGQMLRKHRHQRGGWKP